MLKLTGGCLCGAVRYQVECVPEPRLSLSCHCSDCQKITGTGHSQTLGVPADAVQWFGADKAKSYTLLSKMGNKVETTFCGCCGTPIGKKYAARPDLFAQQENIVAFHAGSLDSDCIDAYNPDFRTWLQTKPDWDNYC